METLLVFPFTKGQNKELLHFFLKCGVTGFSFNVRYEQAVGAALNNDSRPLALWKQLQERLGANNFRETTVFGSWEHSVKKDVILWAFRQETLAIILEVFPRWPTDSFGQHFEWDFYKGRQLLVSTTSNQSLLIHNLIPIQLSDLKGQGFSFVNQADHRKDTKALVDPNASTNQRKEWPHFARAWFDSSPPHIRNAADNPNITKWWTPAHDRILKKHIVENQWTWNTDMSFDELLAATGEAVIKQYKKEAGEKWQWRYDLHMFARARAMQIGLDREITRLPEWRVCPLCNQNFHESSTRVERLGIEQMDICRPCLEECLWGKKSDALSREEVINYLHRLAETIQRVPPSDFGSGADTLLGFSTPKRGAILELLKGRPSLTFVKYLFGSWLAALVEAGILADGTQEGVFGTRCLAKDGHQCLSLAEKTIDDFLTIHNIPHDKEVPYPGARYRADFSVRGIFIEYFGLKGNQEYDLKTMAKIDFCNGHSIQLVELYAEDLINDKKLKEKLGDVWKFNI
jgi:hypothetical protein